MFAWIWLKVRVGAGRREDACIPGNCTHTSHGIHRMYLYPDTHPRQKVGGVEPPLNVRAGWWSKHLLTGSHYPTPFHTHTLLG